jgi:hypothetical protein
MRVSTLPSPGLLSNGIRIRIEAAKAISAVEINAGIPANSGKSKTAKPLADFFTACIAAISGLYDVVAPTIATRSATPTNTKRITLTYNEGLNKANVPDKTDFVVTGQVRTVDKVTIDGPFVHVDVTVALAAGAVSIAYTQSATAAKRLQDASGNQAASFTATAVTNTIV